MEQPLKVLMLEDSETDAELIRRLLKKTDTPFDFRLSMTKEAYLRDLEEFEPDLILSDNSLLQFNALEALKVINQRSIHIPFILVTGNVSEEFAADIIKQGADDYILKDRLARLPAAIAAALKQQKFEKEKREAEQKIIQSETNLRTIFENTSEGFLLMDKDGIVKALNSKASEYAFFSKKNDIRVGESIYNFIEEERKGSFKIIMEKVLNGNSIQYDRSYEMENGDIQWLDFSVTPVSQEGEIKGICIAGRDITARKKVEKELNKNFIEKHALAKRMSTILNTLPANIALLDAEGTIVDVNDAWRNFADDNGFIGNNHGVGDNYIAISKLASGEDKIDGKEVARGIKAVIENKASEFVFEYPCHSPKIKRWFRMVVTPLSDKEYTGAVVMHVDISALRHLEQERLIIKMDEQKKINQAMLQAQERERNQLGRELHDNISQLLAAIKMKLEYGLENKEKGIQTILECVDHVKEAMTETRNLSHRMVIPRFEDSGFENALKYLIKNYNNQQRSVRLEAVKLDEKKIPSAIKESLYRIVQEQLNNIEKYAKASEVTVHLDGHTEHIVMLIEDNGVGFDMKKKRTGIGLTNILNRAESYNGSAKIVSEPGKGCKLFVDVPVTGEKGS